MWAGAVAKQNSFWQTELFWKGKFLGSNKIPFGKHKSFWKSKILLASITTRAHGVTAEASTSHSAVLWSAAQYNVYKPGSCRPVLDDSGALHCTGARASPRSSAELAWKT